MDRLAITAITNFLLASELFFLAGMMARTPKARFSAAWLWTAAMLALATSALLGGIDHGFVESAGMDRFQIQRLNWLVMGLVTLLTLLATARQFLAPRWLRPVLIVGLLQLAVYAVVILAAGSFLVVAVNYAPVVVLLLVLSARGLRDGTGSWQLIAGVVALLVATAVQVGHVDTLAPLDHDALYHVIAMAGAPFLYWGGQRLKVT